MESSQNESVGRSRFDRFAEWLARTVASEGFAVAFVWFAVLLTLLPACLFYVVGFHVTGAVHLGFASGAVGIVIGLVAVRGMLTTTWSSRRSLPR